MGADRQRSQRIEIRVADLKQLFNSIDPSPFREKDLDPDAEEFIVEWALETHRKAPLELVVHVERPPEPGTDTAYVPEAIHENFRARARATRSRLRLTFRTGRVALLIGVVCLAGSMILGSLAEQWLEGTRAGELVREGVLIGGWVAMWKPLDTFLYEWWPIAAEARLFDRLSQMPVRIEYAASPMPSNGTKSART